MKSKNFLALVLLVIGMVATHKASAAIISCPVNRMNSLTQPEPAPIGTILMDTTKNFQSGQYLTVPIASPNLLASCNINRASTPATLWCMFSSLPGIPDAKIYAKATVPLSSGELKLGPVFFGGSYYQLVCTAKN